MRGTAAISAEPALLAEHEVRGTLPASVLVVTVERVYFQCARAIKRSHLWDSDFHADPTSLPTAGQMMLEVGGFVAPPEAEAYDAALDDRQSATLY